MAPRRQRQRNVSPPTSTTVTGSQDTSTQTSPDKNIDLISQLKRELEIMRLEMSKSKQPSNDVAKVVAPVPEFHALQETSTANRLQTSNKSIKGCTCKGRCASRVCGCVKKDLRCGESCKCNSENCQNQIEEEDKENIGSTNTQIVQTQTDNQNLQNVSALKPSENDLPNTGQSKLENESLNRIRKLSKSIFSPDDTHGDQKSWLEASVTFTEPIAFHTTHQSTHVDDETQTLQSTMNEDHSEYTFLQAAAPSTPAQATNIVRNFNSNHNSETSPNEKLSEEIDVRVKIEFSSSSSSNYSSPEQFDDPNFNPMRPSRQLQRSPVGLSMSMKSVRDSEIYLPLPMPKLEEEPLKSPDEIN